MSFTIEIDDKRLQRDFKKLKNDSPVALSKALNTAATETKKTELPGLILSRYSIKKPRLNKGIAVTKKAKKSSLGSEVTAGGDPISLTSFVGTRWTKKSKKGASVAVIKGKRKIIKHSFIRAKRGQKTKQVFQRKTADRYPLKALKGPSIPSMTSKIEPKLGPVALKKLADNVAKQLDNLISKG